MEALKIAKPGDSISTACARREMPTKVKTALRTVLLSCSDVPGTEGRKTQLRFNGHGNNLLFGSPSFFMTPNFADTYSPLVLLLHKGPGKDSHLSTPQLYDNITRAQPSMPSLEQMHQIVAADPRAQAKFGILMTELHYRYIIGVERLHIGRHSLARPPLPVQDVIAASLQPCVAPGTTDVQAPFEAQGRGFFHGHGKGHSILAPTVKWMRAAVRSGLATAARKLREALLDTAVTVQYDAANESANQLGVVGMPDEPFTRRQQRQSRMDGGMDEDGSLRQFVPTAEPVVQPYLSRERARAAARIGSH